MARLVQRMSILRAALPALVALLAPALAHAASSEWAKVEGGAVRVVVSPVPDSSGKLRGALQISLEPGWKTYWLDPGDSGVPPSVGLQAGGKAGAVSLQLPAPRRHQDDGSTWAGYDHSIDVALTLDPPKGWKNTTLDFAVFIGICENICIPVSADFAVDHTNNADGDAAAVDAAFAALPKAPREDFAVTDARIEGETLEVLATMPAGAELFLASTESFAFGEPVPNDTGFSVPVHARPDDPARVETARYTLVGDGEAVSGEVEIGGR